MRIPLPALVIIAALCPSPIALASQQTTCTADPRSQQLTVRCSDGKTWTVKSAGLILPPLLRCSQSLQECCQTGFRGLRDIQLKDLIRVAEGQPPVCHMLASDILRQPRADLSALPEIDDTSPAPEAKALARSSSRDRNRVLVPEAQEVVRRLRKEFDLSGRCPREALDIGVVMRIYQAAEGRAQLLPQTPVDVALLVARPQLPEGSAHDPALPAACGYNATFKQWHQTSFHCKDQRLCFDQSHASLMHACVGFGRQQSEPFFYQTQNCRNVPGCHEVEGGECTGTARLTPLGQGLFLRVLLNLRGEPYYYGILFSPARPNTF